jgi:hypothetical protein
VRDFLHGGRVIARWLRAGGQHPREILELDKDIVKDEAK